MLDSCVYVQDKDYEWLPANVLSQGGNEVKVRVFDVDSKKVKGERTVNLSDYPSHQLPLQNVDVSGNLMVTSDMVDLPSLHEAAILYNLRARHLDCKPYTRVGDLIIAVNPFQWIPDLYAENVRNAYIQKLIWDPPSGGDVKAGLPPHVYETSSMAYRGLAVDGNLQSILVSGESGAGKTETVKIVMSHLASIQSAEVGDPESDHHHLVVQRVLDSNPLLEAFGNAKTVRNDNSSRFGKFIQMQFDVEDATSAAYSGKSIPSCILAGSTCETYLLEKSRVVGHEEAERTYHIFYQMVAISDEKKKGVWEGLVGKNNDSFRYVGETDTKKIEGKTDAERYEVTAKALELLGVTGDRLKMFLRAVCTVLQLGNISFEEEPSDNEKSMISSEAELLALSDLMGVSIADVKKALTFRTVTAGKGETFVTPLNVGYARDGCDSFAKEIYQQIFDWLVREINAATCAEENYDNAAECDEYGLIGLLDIFGFESFEVNRFEQLCINYTNEKLQQKYTLDIFRSVQEEYAYEGIALGEISFTDNAEVLNLLEGRMGLLSMLNEECVRPNGNDISFVSKVKTVNKEVALLVNKKLHKPAEFGIEHYAGIVTYDATNFVQKNTDSLPKDLIDCACKSSNLLIKVELKAAVNARVALAASSGRRGMSSMLTVAAKFKTQLSQLMHDVTKTQTRYIRCIKPNPGKVPIEMNMLSSAEQLRCAGVVAAVTISRVAFPNRLMHETVIERFACLTSANVQYNIEGKKQGEIVGSIVSLLVELLKNSEVKKDSGAIIKAFECGKSRVYFRCGTLELLEARRLVKLAIFAITIEKHVRRFTARSVFLRLKAATICSQTVARRTIARNAFCRAQNACLVLTCWTRCMFAKMDLNRRKREKAAIKIQCLARTDSCVAAFRRCRTAAISIQQIARGTIQRPKYRIALKEAEEEARVNSKLVALQKRLKEAEMKYFQADKQRIQAEKRAEEITEGKVVVIEKSLNVPSEAIDQPGQGVSSLQQRVGDKSLIDESTEMLDFLRKEVFNLKSVNYLLRTAGAASKEENKQLSEHCMSVEASLKVMKQNVNTMSQNNMKIAVTASKQKSTIHDVKQSLKTSQLKHSNELKKIKDENAIREKLHQAEASRMKRELERLRRVIAQAPVTSQHKQSRATFKNHPRSGVSSLQQSVLMKSPDASRSSSFSRSASRIPNIGEKDKKWDNDLFRIRQRGQQREKSQVSTEGVKGHNAVPEKSRKKVQQVKAQSKYLSPSSKTQYSRYDNPNHSKLSLSPGPTRSRNKKNLSPVRVFKPPNLNNCGAPLSKTTTKRATTTQRGSTTSLGAAVTAPKSEDQSLLSEAVHSKTSSSLSAAALGTNKNPSSFSPSPSKTNSRSSLSTAAVKLNR